MLNWEINQYAVLIDKIMTKGQKRSSRAGDVYSIFGESITIDMSTEFPLLRGRKMFYRSVLGELAAMLRGPKNIADFKKFGCNYWDSWGNKETGEINVDYGNSWIDFNGTNQLDELVTKLRNAPTDRRLLVSGWRPDRVASLDLPCCHMLYQWYVRDNKFLDMLWYQRSVDTMVGLPSDIILCAAWNAILAAETGYTPGTIKLVLGDTHIYSNHLEPTLDYLRNLNSLSETVGTKEPLNYTVNKDTTLKTFVPDDILVVYNGKHLGPITFKLNV